jgi:hypothetical protein
VALNGAHQDTHDGSAQVVTPRQEVPHAGWQTQEPLAHGHIGQHVVHQVRRAFGHATPAAPRAEPSALVREGNQALGVARATLEPGEAAGQPGSPPRGLCVVGWEPPAAEERAELVVDEPRQAVAAADSTLNDSTWSRTTR